VTSDLGRVRRLSASGYLSAESQKEGYTYEGVTREMSTTWGSAAFSAHYRDRLGADGIFDASLGHSRFRSDLDRVKYGHFVVGDDGPESEPGYDTLVFGEGVMSETSADLRVTWHAGGAKVTTGTRATRFANRHDYHVTDPYYLDDDILGFFAPLSLRESRWRLAAWASVAAPLGRGFSTRAGLRADRFQGLATTLAPFAELSYAASWWSARVSAARSHQELASVRNEEALASSFLAYDLLVPVSEAPVPRNTEFSVGWEGSRGGLRVRLDAYARKLDYLRLPEIRANPIRGTVLGDPALWEVASGTARGVEASWLWMWDGGVSVLGSYRWARVSRTVGARTYTPRFHRDHEFELGSSYGRGGSSWSVRVSLRSGQRSTPWLATVPIVEYHQGRSSFGLSLLGGEYNSVKLPHYARIDVGWRHESEVSWFGGGSVAPYVSVVNLFSLPNVVGWLPMANHGGEGHATKVFERQLPMMPFLGVEFRF